MSVRPAMMGACVVESYDISYGVNSRQHARELHTANRKN